MKSLSKIILLTTLIPISYYSSNHIKSTFSYLYYSLDPLNERIHNPIPAKESPSLEFKSLNNPYYPHIKTLEHFKEEYISFLPKLTSPDSNYQTSLYKN